MNKITNNPNIVFTQRRMKPIEAVVVRVCEQGPHTITGFEYIQ